MADDTKSFEKKLDRDFLYYLTLTNDLFKNLQGEEQKRMCKVWLTYLFGKAASGATEKCDRNVYLSRLILQMQNGKLKGIFLESPPTGRLPSSFPAFGLPTEIEGLRGFENKGFQVDASVGVGSGDFFESSRDGRTYVATRHLPQGVMAYIAVTNNEGDPVWVPQPCPTKGQAHTEKKKETASKQEGFFKKLADFVSVPLSNYRKSPEEREKVLEWMDKIISDCNKWVQGEDPHNMELEQLFQQLYEDYKQDPENNEILKHPKQVRNIIFKDIREKIAERRKEVAERELILDQYEAAQYEEVITANDALDSVWIECAKRPLNESVKLVLDSVYPSEVVCRFFELLCQERMLIITRGEQRAKKVMNDLSKLSVDDVEKELLKLKKVEDDYKEYYCIYKDVEKVLQTYERECKEKHPETSKFNVHSKSDKLKEEIEREIQQAKESFDKERKVRHELEEKLEEATQAYNKVYKKMSAKADKLKCEMDETFRQKRELEEQVIKLKKRRDELKNQLTMSRCTKN